MATHLPGEIAGASGSVIGEIQLRVPLEHYSAVTLTLHQCCQCTQHRKRLTESCSLLLAESKVPCPAWRLKPPSTHVTFDILRSTHTQSSLTVAFPASVLQTPVHAAHM